MLPIDIEELGGKRILHVVLYHLRQSNKGSQMLDSLRSKSTPKGRLYEAPCPDCGSKRWLDKRRVNNPCPPCSSARRVKHGASATSLYRRWAGIKTRCTNPKATHYEYYGGKGVKMSEPWQGDFEVFKEWAESNGYSPELEIDRIDPDGDYTPENCQWVPHQVNSQQRRNARCTVEKARAVKKALEEGLSIIEAAERADIPYMSAWHISKGNTWKNA